MTDKMISTPYAVPCLCGTMLPRGAKARRGKDRLFYDCHLCRERPPVQPMRKASPYCLSGFKDGCTCSMCF